ncbi:unnamed protein product [Urochloa humidicola]
MQRQVEFATSREWGVIPGSVPPKLHENCAAVNLEGATWARRPSVRSGGGGELTWQPPSELTGEQIRPLVCLTSYPKAHPAN